MKKLINFKGYEFNPKSLTSRPDCPQDVLATMVKNILSRCPDDVDITEYSNSVAVTRKDKKIIISAWEFNLSDWPNGRPFNYFVKDGSDRIIVFGIQFYDRNEFKSNLGEPATDRYAIGYKSNNQTDRRIAQRDSRLSADNLSKTCASVVMDFLSDEDNLVKLVAEHMPKDAAIKVANIFMKASFKYKGFSIYVKYKNGKLEAEIQREWSDTEFVYGDRYANYSTSVILDTPEKINSYDYQALWDNLYDNRGGWLLHHGSLGT